MIKVKRPNAQDVQAARRLTSVPIDCGLPAVDEMWIELCGYMDILLGREDPPIESPYLALAECATAYYGRAQEMDAMIHNGERQGQIVRGSSYYKFRTGELRSFLELSKKVAELGSRRLTQERLLHDQREIDSPS